MSKPPPKKPKWGGSFFESPTRDGWEALNTQHRRVMTTLRELKVKKRAAEKKISAATLQLNFVNKEIAAQEVQVAGLRTSLDVLRAVGVARAMGLGTDEVRAALVAGRTSVAVTERPAGAESSPAGNKFAGDADFAAVAKQGGKSGGTEEEAGDAQDNAGAKGRADKE